MSSLSSLSSLYRALFGKRAPVDGNVEEWDDVQNRHTLAVKFLAEDNAIYALLKEE